VTEKSTQPAQPSTLESRPLIVVFGGTGNQGGSVLKSLLKEKRFRLRTLTRNIHSKKAKKLASKGVEVFCGNMHQIEDLRHVYDGAYGVFACTNYWDPATRGKETALGNLLARTAKEAGVQHYIWSSLPNVQKITAGKHYLPHFTHKSKVNKHIKSLGFPNYHFLLPAFYYQNFGSHLAPKKDGSTLVYTLPMNEQTYIAGFDIQDIGPVVQVLFNNKDLYNKREIPLAGDNMHPQDYIIKMALVTGLSTRIELVDPVLYKQTMPIEEDFFNTLQYFNEFPYYGQLDWRLGKEICPQIKTWEEYLRSEMKAVQSQ